MQISYGQAELVSSQPLTVRSLWFPLFEDELSYQQGRYATGFSHMPWNGSHAAAGVVRCKPPANRFSEEYKEMQRLLAQSPVKRGA